MSEEILIALKEIHARYCIPASEKNYTDKDYACMQYEKLVIHLQQEIERLNNIINKARRKLGEHKYYLTPTEDQNKENEIITEEVYQILHENLYELKELKENKYE